MTLRGTHPPAPCCKGKIQALGQPGKLEEYNSILPGRVNQGLPRPEPARRKSHR